MSLFLGLYTNVFWEEYLDETYFQMNQKKKRVCTYPQRKRVIKRSHKYGKMLTSEPS